MDTINNFADLKNFSALDFTIFQRVLNLLWSFGYNAYITPEQSQNMIFFRETIILPCYCINERIPKPY